MTNNSVNSNTYGIGGGNNTTAQTTLLQRHLTGTPSPLAIISRLKMDSNANNLLLLESSEIQTRDNLKSILVLSAALRIECNGQRVKIEAITMNGQNALSQIGMMLDEALIENRQDKSLTLLYPKAETQADEMSRLKMPGPIDCLRQVQQTLSTGVQHPFGLLLAGVFGFDFIANFEDLPAVTPGSNQCPDYLFYLAESVLLLDHQSQRSDIIFSLFDGDNASQVKNDLARSMTKISELCQQLIIEKSSTSNSSIDKNENEQGLDLQNVETNISDQEFAQNVSRLKQNIVDGDVFQVVPSRHFRMPVEDTLASYEKLKQTNPSPYMFYLDDKDFCLFGASPESALKYTASDNLVELYPIAGTRPRGVTTSNNENSTLVLDNDLDARIEAELKQDRKETAEHMMLVDLARNDIARISQPGTVSVPRLLEVDRYSKVMHLVSNVKGQLKPEFDAFHAYQACMNMGTLTGAPKIRATELIREVEGERRGSYGGAIGYINATGDMDTCIVIRSAWCKDRYAWVQAGAGVVFDSEPELEAIETKQKANAVIEAILLANNMMKNHPDKDIKKDIDDSHQFTHKGF